MIFLIHCDGGILRVNAALHIWWRASTTGSPPCFRASAVIDGSHPGAFPTFICSIAFAVSLLVISPVSIGRTTSAEDGLMPALSDWLFRSLEKYCYHSDSSSWVFAILVPSDFLTFAAAFGVLFPYSSFTTCQSTSCWLVSDARLSSSNFPSKCLISSCS